MAESGRELLSVPILGPLVGGLVGAALYKFFVGRFLPTAEPEPRAASPLPRTDTYEKVAPMADFVGAVGGGGGGGGGGGRDHPVPGS